MTITGEFAVCSGGWDNQAMTLQSRASNPSGPRFAALALEYPMSLGQFESYDKAQKAVDTLSDKEFPVQNCLIVGSGLRQLERVTGRLSIGRVIFGGALSGVWMGLFVGLIFALFQQGANIVALVLSTMLFGAIFGAVWAGITYGITRSMTGGNRDFTSVSQIVPSHFELLVEHKFAQQARELLGVSGYVPPTVQSAPEQVGPGDSRS